MRTVRRGGGRITLDNSECLEVLEGVETCTAYARADFDRTRLRDGILLKNNVSTFVRLFGSADQFWLSVSLPNRAASRMPRPTRQVVFMALVTAVALDPNHWHLPCTQSVHLISRKPDVPCKCHRIRSREHECRMTRSTWLQVL